ncbi:hypothetical protein J2S43_006172 [Catenuloplanes nepalensis]|uniref:Uncharacterized protein n=1 Tax=Catenuloplanes nepalensis TaxID=587533 RepID=A0ABT9N1T5_9ACTN|nr:hypothetical protein [Catenuloplanes nepalensis]MDP9797660.1 hypothetical protein [Catenuloplanes nepalensis]
MEIYTMLQIPSMSPALLLSVAGPVRPMSLSTHVSSPWLGQPTALGVSQVDQVLTQAELRVRDDRPMASGAIKLQGTTASLVSSDSESLKGRNGSEGNGITGNKGMAKRAFGGARGVPPRGRPV